MFASAKNKTRYYFSERDPVALGGATNFNPFTNAGDGAKALRADPKPSLKAAPKLFPSVPKGTPASANQAPITVTNDGDAPLVIASGADAIKIEAEDTDGGAATAADFAVVSDDCRGKTLARNATCVVNVGFKPTRSNYTSVARVVIDSNSDDAVERILIAGAQTPPKVLAFHGATDAVNTAGVTRSRRSPTRTTSWWRTPRTRDRVHGREPRELPRGRLPRQQGRPAQRGAGVRAAGLRPGWRRLRRHRRRG